MSAAAGGWQDVVAVQPAPSEAVVLATLLVAVALVVPRPVWRRTRHVVTVVHEGAHALVAVLTGRRLDGVRLHRDSSGLTVSRGRPTGPGMVLTAAAGYLGPSVLGLLGVLLLLDGRSLLVLWLLLAGLVPLVLMVRNAFGLLLLLVGAGGLVLVTTLAEPRAQSTVAHVAVWFLLVAAPRPVLELRARGRSSGSDVDQLAALTHLPAGLWWLLLVTATLAALAAGVVLLLPW